MVYKRIPFVLQYKPYRKGQYMKQGITTLLNKEAELLKIQLLKSNRQQDYNRIEGYLSLLVDYLDNYDLSENNNVSKLNAWVMLGSLTETLMNIYLSPNEDSSLGDMLMTLKQKNLLTEDDLNHLEVISTNKNAILSFSTVHLGSWEDFKESILFTCHLMRHVSIHLSKPTHNYEQCQLILD